MIYIYYFHLFPLIEEWLAQKVCYLLIELCLLCKQADKGISNISYIENQFLPYKLMDETSNTPDSIVSKFVNLTKNKYLSNL